jgi:hypothetical protein
VKEEGMGDEKSKEMTAGQPDQHEHEAVRAGGAQSMRV